MTTNFSSLLITRIPATSFQSSDSLEHPACRYKSVWWTVAMSRLFIIVCTTNSLGGSVGVLFTFCLETVGFPVNMKKGKKKKRKNEKKKKTSPSGKLRPSDKPPPPTHLFLYCSKGTDNSPTIPPFFYYATFLFRSW